MNTPTPPFLAGIIPDYTWTIDDEDMAILNDFKCYPYSLPAFESAINSIKRNESIYATPEAFQKHLGMMEEGRALLESHLQSL